eukprot:5290383-Amphidinium_carterae.3
MDCYCAAVDQVARGGPPVSGRFSRALPLKDGGEKHAGRRTFSSQRSKKKPNYHQPFYLASH